MSGSCHPGLSPGWDILFLGKTLPSHGTSLQSGVYMGTGKLNAMGNPRSAYLGINI